MDMAAAGGEPGTRLINRLVTAPHQFDFFQAVRLAQNAVYRDAVANGREPPVEVGSTASNADADPPVTFHCAVTLGFPGAAITRAQILAEADGGRDDARSEADVALDGETATPVPGIDLEVTCFGLVGPTGSLPLFYTTLVIERIRRFRDHSLQAFLDVFNQRAISLLYRSWAKYRQPVQQERTILRGIGTEWDDGAAKPRDAITAAVACLVGLGGRGLGEKMAVDDDVIFRYAGHYSHFPRCAESLELLLTDLYGVPVQVHQFIGRWLDLEKPDQTRLGTREHPDGWNTQLGSMAIVGSRVWSVQSVLEISAGPLSLEQFRRRLPGTRELAKLGDLARLYISLNYDIHVRPILAAADVPMTKLGGAMVEADGWPAGSRLGWTTWLLSTASAVARRDAAFAVVP
jgi:type VI secretion system protein ImpH